MTLLRLAAFGPRIAAFAFLALLASASQANATASAPADMAASAASPATSTSAGNNLRSAANGTRRSNSSALAERGSARRTVARAPLGCIGRSLAWQARAGRQVVHPSALPAS